MDVSDGFIHPLYKTIKSSDCEVEIKELISLFDIVKNYYKSQTKETAKSDKEIKEYFQKEFNLEEVDENFLLKISRILERNSNENFVLTKKHLIGIGS